MPVTKKTFLEEKKQEADKASQEQINDIFAAISELGSNNSNSSEIKAAPEQDRGKHNFNTVTTTETHVAEGIGNEQKDEKPGYISVVIPNSLKKKWKIYSTQHNMSLTDCVKLGMKLLEEMENQNKIKIEGGFITFSA